LSSKRSRINLDEIEIDRKKVFQKIKEKKIIIIEDLDKNQFLDIEDMMEEIN
jgi:hypothetical protein